MRIDKYLKVSRLIKRRTIANEACSAGRVSVNGKPVKAGAEVKVGDIVTLGFGTRQIKVEVMDLSEHVTKDGAALLYKVIEG
jgi:ribosomal 50S subunit-recycling heat shock protein